MQVFHTVTRRLGTAKTESTVRSITEPVQSYTQYIDFKKIHVGFISIPIIRSE